MEYFLDNINYYIVTRPHKINAEVIDGRLSEITDSECFIIAHVPNNKWSFNVHITDTTDIITAYNKAHELGVYGIRTEPVIFYTAVPKNYLDLYLQKHNFIITQPEVKVSISMKNISEPIKLVRSSEPATYTYKSPNQK